MLLIVQKLQRKLCFATDHQTKVLGDQWSSKGFCLVDHRLHNEKKEKEKGKGGEKGFCLKELLGKDKKGIMKTMNGKRLGNRGGIQKKREKKKVM